MVKDAAHLAADEMGISLHTIRSYIRKGYRFWEAYDETEYPVIQPQDGFMRLTTLHGRRRKVTPRRHPPISRRILRCIRTR
ncbi:MAG: hypothetical protein U0521_09020 [Anaerolineae bacterium]